MELKQEKNAQVSHFSGLLIVPYGIETQNEMCKTAVRSF